MSKIFLVSDINTKSNINMYCNYARMKPTEERCLKCENECKHKGKHTILEKGRRGGKNDD